MKREEGYYWIKIDWAKMEDEWQPAQWSKIGDIGVWQIIDSEVWFCEEDIAEVGEKIVKR